MSSMASLMGIAIHIPSNSTLLSKYGHCTLWRNQNGVDSYAKYGRTIKRNWIKIRMNDHLQSLYCREVQYLLKQKCVCQNTTNSKILLLQSCPGLRIITEENIFVWYSNINPNNCNECNYNCFSKSCSPVEAESVITGSYVISFTFLM